MVTFPKRQDVEDVEMQYLGNFGINGEPGDGSEGVVSSGRKFEILKTQPQTDKMDTEEMSTYEMVLWTALAVLGAATLISALVLPPFAVITGTLVLATATLLALEVFGLDLTSVQPDADEFSLIK